jgi:hypothetical protein
MLNKDEEIIKQKAKKKRKKNLMSEWMLFNTKWALFQLYHGENKLYFDEMMMMSVDQHTQLDCL